MHQGSFEREIEGWASDLRNWVFSHERFTWLNLILAISPSPIAALLGFGLAGLQLSLCSQGRIPRSERTLLVAALLLSLCNLILTIMAFRLLARGGLTLWQMISPFWWLRAWFGLPFGQTSV